MVTLPLLWRGHEVDRGYFSYQQNSFIYSYKIVFQFIIKVKGRIWVHFGSTYVWPLHKDDMQICKHSILKKDIIKNLQQSIVAQACNLIYSEAEIGRITVQG
jgi:hypothetical protein